MRHPVSYIFFTLAALCASIHAEAIPDPLAFPGPSASSQLPAVSAQSFSGLFRRNIGKMLVRREDTGVRNEAGAEKLDLAAWSKEASTACAQKLSTTKDANNAAGVAACYNVPVLLSTGVFVADLRLFQVAAATGDWVDVDRSSSSNNYNVSLLYDNAAIVSRNLTAAEITASQEGLNGTELATKMVRDYQFIGQMDASVVQKKLDDSTLKGMLVPTMQLLATTKSGKNIQVPLNATDATYVTGVFSNITSGTVEQTKAPPFKLPGTRILIVPVGLYLFSAYMALALAIFGYGTVERARFRDQYRKRLAMAGPMR